MLILALVLFVSGHLASNFPALFLGLSDPAELCAEEGFSWPMLRAQSCSKPG